MNPIVPGPTTGSPIGLFTNLDAPFRNIDTSTEPILFQTKDHLVQYKFELPIPTTPG